MRDDLSLRCAAGEDLTDSHHPRTRSPVLAQVAPGVRWLLAIALLLSHAPLRSMEAAPVAGLGNPGVPWPATDALGRSLPLATEVGPIRPGRQVGMLYFLNHANRPAIYDVSQILEQDPDALMKPSSPLWGPFHAPHYWAQPLFGYYHNHDPWVIRRHGQLLADAGVDTLVFDTTNGSTLRSAYSAVANVFTAMRKQGERTPQICFMVNTRAGACAQQLYEELYRPGLFADLWYRWEGKPLLICDPAEASPEVRAFFTLRKAHWPFTMVDTPYAWHWEATYPQPYGYTTDPQVPEMVNVSVAQNLRVRDGKVTNMSNGDGRGRGFHGGRMDHSPEALARGPNAQEQWTRALELDPPFVLVTGWNEWNTSRFDDPTDGKVRKRVVFMDQFGPQFSRDIEPMQGGFGDNYYYQMVANIRRYKGAPALPATSAAKTIAIPGDFAQWRDVEPTCTGHLGDTAPRHHPDVTGKPLTNATGRNDLAVMKVAMDDDHLYGYVRTASPITPATDAAGLWMLLDTDLDPRTGWHGYDIIINREPGLVERHGGSGWTWTPVGTVTLRLAGQELHWAVPRATLGLSAAAIDIKWADHLPQPCTIMDLYGQGDVAPAGRFNVRFAIPRAVAPPGP